MRCHENCVAHSERSNSSETSVPFQVSSGMEEPSADGLLFCRLTQKKLESVNTGNLASFPTLLWFRLPTKF